MPEPTTTSDEQQRRREFNSLMATSYHGELLGEALFSALASRWQARGNGPTLAVLAELERTMAQLLRLVMTQLGIDAGNDAGHRQKGETQAETVIDTPWRRFMELFGDGTTMVLERYDRLRTVSPPDTYWVVDLLIAHEQALASFATAELASDPTSLVPIHEVLERIRSYRTN